MTPSYLIGIDIGGTKIAVGMVDAQGCILAQGETPTAPELGYQAGLERMSAILRGLLLFYLVCSVGLFANVGVAFSVYDQEPIWWLAGAAGALMGVVWNYAMSGLFVWRKR